MPILHWIGKEKVVNHHQDVAFSVLEHKYGFTAEGGNQEKHTNSGNKIIHGDNLEGLKALLPEYEGKVNCIYIDPPYNTGEEKWVYNDNVNDPGIKKWLGEIVGKEGEDLSRHDKWICMMYPRLQLLNKLLAFDGVMAISISFHELNSLYFLCKEIFATRQVTTVTVQTSGGKPSDGFNYVQEYIVFIAPKGFSPNPSVSAMNNYSSPYHGMNLAGFNQVTRPNQVYPIYVNKLTGVLEGVGKSLQELIDDRLYVGEKENFIFDYTAPDGVAAVWPVTIKGDSCVWRLTPARFQSDWEKGYIKITPQTNRNNQNLFSIQYLAEGIIKKIESGELEVYRISDRSDVPTLEIKDFKSGGVNITTLWTDKVYYTTRGSNELTNILGSKGKFPYPKPMQLIKDIIQRISRKDSIILDSFGGSGTTAHAVLSLNKDDNGMRRFLMIEMMDYAESITAERVKLVSKGYSYRGTAKEIIYSKELTLQNITKATEIIDEANLAVSQNATSYTKIGKPKIEDNCIKVIGIKEYDGFMEGLGGEFDYYELGQPIFKEDKNLNEKVGEDKIRKYIYYAETRQHLERQRTDNNKYLLDTYNDTGYYFYYEKDKPTTLGIDTLSIVTENAEQYIIYADKCLLDKEYMLAKNIVFKKIPRDIKRF
jgi:adenine-specific DNA-methyltransferase